MTAIMPALSTTRVQRLLEWANTPTARKNMRRAKTVFIEFSSYSICLSQRGTRLFTWLKTTPCIGKSLSMEFVSVMKPSGVTPMRTTRISESTRLAANCPYEVVAIAGRSTINISLGRFSTSRTPRCLNARKSPTALFLLFPAGMTVRLERTW